MKFPAPRHDIAARVSTPMRLAGKGLCLLLPLALGACQAANWLWLSFQSPPLPFERTATPPPPDYARPQAWLAFPRDKGPERAAPPSLPAIDEGVAKADVFFIHPTTYLKNDVWNVAYDTPGEYDAATLLGQASAFNACCRIYAPRYRQATLKGLANNQAMAMAYSDLKRAFDYYLAHENHGRPFIIAAHSQGSAHATLLLQEEIVGTPLQRQLVAAYVVGSYVPSDFPAIGLPVCAAPRQTGCVLSWNTAQSGRTASYGLVDPRQHNYLWQGRLKTSGQPPAICVNPLTWRADETSAPASANQGSLALPEAQTGGSLPALIPHLTGAACRTTVLYVDIPRDAPAGIHNVLSFLYGSYHLLDYGLFFGNIRDNAVERVDAWRAS